MTHNDVGIQSHDLLLHFKRLAAKQQRENAILAINNIYRQFAAIQNALPSLADLRQFNAIGLVRQRDLVNHSPPTPSLRAVRFHKDTSVRLSGPGFDVPFCPFLDGAIAAKRAAETAAISARPSL